MTLLNYLLGRKKNTASVAKERLQIILAREHTGQSGPDYLPALKKDILEVVAKYIEVDLDKIQVTLDKDGDTDILELNIVLDREPEQQKLAMHS